MLTICCQSLLCDGLEILFDKAQQYVQSSWRLYVLNVNTSMLRQSCVMDCRRGMAGRAWPQQSTASLTIPRH